MSEPLAAVAVLVEAQRETVWEALLQIDLLEVRAQVTDGRRATSATSHC